MSQHKTDPAAMTPADRALWEARDIILCAATSLESGQPQPWTPGATAKLRAAADLLTKLDDEAITYINELGANTRGRVVDAARASLARAALAAIRVELPDHMQELRAFVERALRETGPPPSSPSLRHGGVE